MTSITPYLKKLDAEILRLRQEIAVRQLEIHRIEESRLTIMSVEQRSQSAEAPLPNGLLNGTSYDQRPALIVREAGTGGEDGSASRAAKLGLNKAGNKRGMINNPSKPGKRNTGNHARYKAEVTALLKANPKSEFSLDTIIQRLGIGPMKGKAKQPLYQAIYELKRDHVLHTPGGPGSYQIANP